MSAITRLEDRLVLIYANAMKARHGEGRVTVHASPEILQAMRDWMRAKTTAPDLGPFGATVWGFPIVEEPSWDGDRIEVHTAVTIP